MLYQYMCSPHIPVNITNVPSDGVEAISSPFAGNEIRFNNVSKHGLSLLTTHIPISNFMREVFSNTSSIPWLLSKKDNQ